MVGILIFLVASVAFGLFYARHQKKSKLYGILIGLGALTLYVVSVMLSAAHGVFAVLSGFYYRGVSASPVGM